MMERIEINSKIIITAVVYPVGRKATQEELAAAILNLEQQLNTEQPTRNQTTNMKLYTRFHFDLSDTKKG